MEFLAWSFLHGFGICIEGGLHYNVYVCVPNMRSKGSMAGYRIPHA
jgi:hypothetical protein